ncbi:hypothetical protein TNCV_2422161 [Trichonephila clavipes]|nr:hypothetical protein TNCV_2422161 [Trichonephila clavipes]
MANRHRLNDATRWGEELEISRRTNHRLSALESNMGFREMWCSLCGNSLQREEQQYADLVKAAKGQQRRLKTVI